jgi:phage-related protein
MSIALGETKEAIGAALIPILNKLLPKLQSLGNFIRDNTSLIVKIGIVIGTFAAGILAANAAIAIYNTIQAVTLALNTALTTSFSALWVATGAVIILGIVAALIALQAEFDIFGKTIDFLKGVFKSFWEYVKLSFENVKGIAVSVFDAIGGAVASWYSGVRKYIDALYSAFKTVFNAIAGIWNNTIGKLSFKVPNWVPGIGGKGFDVPDIPMLAEGGIVTGPTIAMIGERGPEAVIPLNRAGAMGGNNITVNMPAGSNGDDVVRALQKWVRNNGALPLTTTTQIRR